MESWCTFDEIDFIENIGSFYNGPIREIDESAEERHVRLLKKYKAAIELRKDWDSIDKDEIVRIVDKELSEQQD